MFGNLTSFEGGLFDEFRRLQEEMDEVFSELPWRAGIRSVARGTYPPINVGATTDKVEVYVFAAGLDPQQLELSIHQGLLTLAGKREVPVNEQAAYYRRERFTGEFRRVIALPDDVDPDRVEAQYRDGVLQVTVPRKEAARPRQIEIK